MKKRKDNLKLVLLFSRYLFLILIALGNLYVFYAVLTLLTAGIVYFFIKILSSSPVILSGSTLLFQTHAVELVEACIAGSAYYLLLILNFTTPMNLRKRVYSIIFSMLTFFIINAIRIVIFTLLINSNFVYFNAMHLVFWYVLSILVVAGIWIATIKIYKIKDIPIYSDLTKIKHTHKS